MRAVITGATSGIGKEFAYRLAGLGYDLVLTGRRMEILEKVAKDIESKCGVEVITKKLNIDSIEEFEDFIMNLNELEDVEFLVNNAGHGSDGTFINSEIEESIKMINVHIMATVKLSKACGQLMKKRKKGYIINVSSMASFNAFRDSAMYCSTKGFITIFSECLGLELREYGVKVQALCPGFVKTDFHSKLNMEESSLKNKGILRWMECKEVVKYSLESIKKEEKYICIPGILNRLLYLIIKITPKRIYYKITASGWKYMKNK